MFEGVLQTHLVLKQPFNLEMMTQLPATMKSIWK